MNGKIDFARLQRVLGKYKFVALILCLGVVLMLLPTRDGAKSTGTEVEDHQQQSESSFDLEDLEHRLQAHFRRSAGWGSATVVLTLHSSGEQVLAQDTSEGTSSDPGDGDRLHRQRYRGGGQRQDHLSRSSGGAGHLRGGRQRRGQTGCAKGGVCSHRTEERSNFNLSEKVSVAMKVWKRNAVVAAIVLFVCVAVYLNWSYGQKDALASDATGS